MLLEDVAVRRPHILVQELLPVRCGGGLYLGTSATAPQAWLQLHRKPA